MKSFEQGFVEGFIDSAFRMLVGGLVYWLLTQWGTPDWLVIAGTAYAVSESGLEIKFKR